MSMVVAREEGLHHCSSGLQRQGVGAVLGVAHQLEGMVVVVGAFVFYLDQWNALNKSMTKQQLAMTLNTEWQLRYSTNSKNILYFKTTAWSKA